MTTPRKPTSSKSPRTPRPPRGGRAPASPRTRPRKKAAPKDGAEPDAPAPLDYQRDYQRHLPIALQLPAAEVLPFRANATRALQNVTVGIAALAPLTDRLRHELPTLALDRFADLPSLARAALWAAEQVRPAPPTDAIALPALRRAQAIRRLLLAAATSLAASGLLPAAEVEHIRAGRGPEDTATDCRQLATLFQEHAAAIAGKTPVTAAQLREAAEAGAALTEQVKLHQGRRVREVAAPLAARIDARDRLWTLLVVGHRELRRAAFWVWMDQADAHVPRLLSFNAPPRPRKTPPPPPPGGAPPSGEPPQP